jgi:hypothetical protein
MTRVVIGLQQLGVRGQGAGRRGSRPLGTFVPLTSNLVQPLAS